MGAASTLPCRLLPDMSHAPRTYSTFDKMGKLMRQWEEHVWTDDQVEKFWDWAAERSPDIYFSFGASKTIVRRYQSYFKNKKVVLDYGCGTGFFLRELAKLNNTLIGVEFSPKSVSVCRTFLEEAGVEAKILHIDETATLKAEVDIISVLEVVEHLYDDRLEELLVNCNRMLRPGGLLFLTTPNEEDLRERQVLCPVSGKVFHRWQHVRSWSSKTLSDFIVPFGFSIVRADKTNLSSSWLMQARIRIGRLRNRAFGRNNLVLIARKTE
ncbi:MAG: class I SAM-dependent methyltransferase [Parvibaculaceae bacterium]